MTPEQIASTYKGGVRVLRRLQAHGLHVFTDAELRARDERIIADMVQRGGDRARMGCPECTITQQMDPNPPTLRCIVCGTGYWTEDDQ